MSKYSPERVCEFVTEKLKGLVRVCVDGEYVVVEYGGVPFTLKQKYDFIYLQSESEFLSCVESMLCEIKNRIELFSTLKYIKNFDSIRGDLCVTVDLDNEYGYRHLGMDFTFYLEDTGIELPYHFISWLSGIHFGELLDIALDNYIKKNLVKFGSEGLDIFLSSSCDPVVMFSDLVKKYLDKQYPIGCYVVFFSDFTCSAIPFDRQRLKTHIEMYERMEYGVKHKTLVYNNGEFKED